MFLLLESIWNHNIVQNLVVQGLIKKNIAKLNELKDDVSNLKDDARVFNESLLMKLVEISALKSQYIMSVYNEAIIKRLTTVVKELSSLKSNLIAKDDELKDTFKGLQEGASKSRKHKQNKRRTRRRKEIR